MVFDNNMHQYSPQQLAKHIAKPLKEWSKQDVMRWIKLNQIQVQQQLFQKGDLDGIKLFKIHPDQLVQNFGLTKYISKQIVEWVEEESSIFDQCVLGGHLSDEDSIEHQTVAIHNLEQPEEESKDKKEQVNDVTERVEIGKWGRKIDRKENIPKLHIGSVQKHKNQIPFKNPYIKFASSQFISVQESQTQKHSQKKLRLIGQSQSFMISQNCKIGRFTQNNIVISEQSVSRSHAEINCLPTSKGDFRYFIKDLKSKYGTFIGCRSTQTNIEGCTFLLQYTEIKILKIQMIKPSPTNKQRTFDISLKVDDKEVKLINKNTVIIGNKKTADIKCDAGTVKIWIDKQKKACCLNVCEGKLYKKLKQFEQWDLQAHMDGSKILDLCFGSYRCTIESIQFCSLCNKASPFCEC